MEITTEELVEVNRKFGGEIRSDSSLRFAEAHSANFKSSYRKAAIWIRAILVDHPFTDANKRTALYAIERILGVRNQEKIVKLITRIAAKNITNIEKLVEMLENANRQENI